MARARGGGSGGGGGDYAEDDEELRSHVIVHDMKPPFLDGRVVFSSE